MKNKYEIRGDITAIFIDSKKYGRMEALVSTKKITKANEFPGKWCAAYSKSTRSFYVQGNMSRASGYRGKVLLHRWITNAPKGMDVDHRDNNTLKNTDDNLRVVTRSENMQNRKGPQRTSSSGIRGVFWHKKSRKWRAQCGVNGKYFHIGLFETIEEAEKAVIEFRKTNMPFSNEEEPA